MKTKLIAAWLLAAGTLIAEPRAISVEVTVPDAAWTIGIDEVSQVGEEIWVIARVSRDPEMMGAAVISKVRASLELELPDLPVQYYVLGKTWNWENEEPYHFIADPKKIAKKREQGTRLYPPAPPAEDDTATE